MARGCGVKSFLGLGAGTNGRHREVPRRRRWRRRPAKTALLLAATLGRAGARIQRFILLAEDGGTPELRLDLEQSVVFRDALGAAE